MMRKLIRFMVKLRILKRKPTIFWGQVGRFRVIEFNDGTAELHKWNNGEIGLLQIGNAQDVVLSHLHWLQCANEHSNLHQFRYL